MLNQVRNPAVSYLDRIAESAIFFRSLCPSNNVSRPVYNRSTLFPIKYTIESIVYRCSQYGKHQLVMKISRGYWSLSETAKYFEWVNNYCRNAQYTIEWIVQVPASSEYGNYRKSYTKPPPPPPPLFRGRKSTSLHSILRSPFHSPNYSSLTNNGLF